METDVGRLLTEALAADVQAVLADKTALVTADTAVSMLVHILGYYWAIHRRSRKE